MTFGSKPKNGHSAQRERLIVTAEQLGKENGGLGARLQIGVLRAFGARPNRGVGLANRWPRVKSLAELAGVRMGPVETLRITNQSGKDVTIVRSRALEADSSPGTAIGASESLDLAMASGDPRPGWADLAVAGDTNQRLAVWWNADAADAMPQTLDGKATPQLGATFSMAGRVCTVTVTPLARTIEVPVAPGHPATVVASPPKWNIRQVVTRFQDAVNDPELLETGQFTWLTRYQDELAARYMGLLGDDAATKARLAPQGDLYAQLTDDNATDHKFETIRAGAFDAFQAAPRENRGPNHNAIQHFFSPGAHTTPYASAKQAFESGANLSPHARGGGREKYDHIFKNPATQTFAIYRKMYKQSAEGCAAWATSLSLRVDHETRGAGLRLLKTRAHHAGQNMPIQWTVNRSTPNAPAGHIMEYTGNLGGSTGDAQVDGPIHGLVQNLDRGLLVAAYVLSGRLLEHNSPNNPLEHYLLVLGYAPTGYGYKFPFWDPDALTSTRRGEVDGATTTGFGLLHFVAPASVGQSFTGGDAGLPAHFTKSGRFSTFAKSSGILCDKDGYHIDELGRSGERGAAIQHRYQVGALYAFSTGGA
jgi:hypothetical protein